jgi:hypothetical protein
VWHEISKTERTQRGEQISLPLVGHFALIALTGLVFVR